MPFHNYLKRDSPFKSFLSAIINPSKPPSTLSNSTHLKPVTSPSSHNMLSSLSLSNPQYGLYSSLRENIPIVDAAISKIVRLLGDFTLSCNSSEAQSLLDSFCSSIPLSSGGVGIHEFISRYFDSLLTFGCAVGEIVLDSNSSSISALYNASLDDIQLSVADNNIDTNFFVKNSLLSSSPVHNTSNILFSTLNPNNSYPFGQSVLKGLPFISEILIKIFHCVEKNFERLGNLRFAVTYKPSDSSSLDPISAKEHANSIASAWSDAMNFSYNNSVKDFICVGDVDIKVIGADNQLIDTNVPVRQLLEQIVAKLGVPPFLLGLSWSTTERMSKQQADILTSEIDYYRSILSPVIIKIASFFLRINGFPDDVSLNWNLVNLQDEVESANARLINAQADKIIGSHSNPSS